MRHFGIISAILPLLCILSCNSREERIRGDYIAFISTPVVIPSSALESHLTHVKEDSTYRLVFYIDSIGCTDCRINSLAEKEQQARRNPLFRKIHFLYIIDVDSLRGQRVLNLLYRYRLEGDFFIDTQKSFVHSNPHFPQNPLFHTFLLNPTDSVVLVGDPFVNERIMGLLDSLIHHKKSENSD